MKCELHCHSCYSKGVKLPREAIPSPREIILEAKRKEMDALALTDHNTTAGWTEAALEAKKQGILLIRGIELNTLDGHVIGLGITEDIPFGLSIEETVERIHEQGGVAIAPHPFDIKGEGVREKFALADAVEIFNSLNLDRFSNFLIRKKIGTFPAVVGSDAHTLKMIGNSVTIADADDMDGLLKDIKRGRMSYTTSYTSVSDVKEWSYLRFSDSRDFVIDYVNKNYSPLKKWISLRLLDKFLQNQEGFFTFLAHFGIFCSYGYGAVKALASV